MVCFVSYVFVRVGLWKVFGCRWYVWSGILLQESGFEWNLLVGVFWVVCGCLVFQENFKRNVCLCRGVWVFGTN